jgi:hypothetical protein
MSRINACSPPSHNQPDEELKLETTAKAVTLFTGMASFFCGWEFWSFPSLTYMTFLSI